MFWYLGWDEAILAGQLSIDLVKLPAIAEIHPARGPMLMKLLLAVMWFLISLALIVSFAAAPIRIKMFMLVPALSGLVMIAMSLYGLMRRRRVRFGEDGVVVQDRRWLRNVDWSAPYSAFQGIQLRKRLINSGPFDRILHIVELTHPNPSLSLPLLITSNDPPPRSALVSVANLFGLSVIEDRNGNDAFLTKAKVFNRPLRDLARSHNLADLYDAGEPVPRELQVQRRTGDEGETLAVTIWPHRPHRLWQTILIAGPTILLVSPFFITNILFLINALILAAIAAVIFLNGLQRCRRAVVSHDQLIYGPPSWTIAPPAPERLKLADIEGVYINQPRAGQTPHIELKTSAQSLHLGQGLSPAALDWLRRFLLSAIVTA